MNSDKYKYNLKSKACELARYGFILIINPLTSNYFKLPFHQSSLFISQKNEFAKYAV